jgi:glycosyltransferase involved in cell wall biosynthesis
MNFEIGVAENALKISIVTATFNAAKHLPRLVASLRAQTDKNFEWIVADGGSTDGSLEILRKVNDLNIVIDSRPDFGLYDALNRAITMCSHDYYLVLGADDILYADGVMNYRKSLKSDSLCVVVGSVMVNGRIRSGFFPDKGWLGAGHVVTEHSVGMLINKHLHEVVGFYSNEYRQL